MFASSLSKLWRFVPTNFGKSNQEFDEMLNIIANNCAEVSTQSEYTCPGNFWDFINNFFPETAVFF